MEGCGLTLGAGGPPGRPREGELPGSPCGLRVRGGARGEGSRGLQPSVLNGARRGSGLGLSSSDRSSRPGPQPFSVSLRGVGLEVARPPAGGAVSPQMSLPGHEGGVRVCTPQGTGCSP